MKTHVLKPKDVRRQWLILDASKMPLGRLATATASLLLGKGKTNQQAHVDGGDYVIVVNAGRLIATGDKAAKKIYYRHSGYPGGIYSRTLSEQMSIDPKKVIQKAVRGMLPDNKLRDGRLKRLKIYTGAEHEHTAQNPQPYVKENE